MSDYIAEEAKEQRADIQAEYLEAAKPFQSQWYPTVVVLVLAGAFYWDIRIGLTVSFFLVIQYLRDILRVIQLGNISRRHDRVSIDECAARLRSIQRKVNPDAFL